MKRVLAFFVVASAVFAASFGPAGATTGPPHNGLIGFSGTDGAFMTIHPDGTGLRVVAKGMGSGVWSPGGARVAFAVWVDARQAMGIYVLRMGAPGALPHRVGAYSRYWVQRLSWRPTGHVLLYADDRMDTSPSVGALRLLAADGSMSRTVAGYRDLNMHPAWSRTGQRIAFTRVVGGDPQGGGTPGAEIWIMRADGTHQTQLTHNRVLDEDPVFAPSGDRIAYVHFASAAMGYQDAGIWLMGTGGRFKHAVTHTPGVTDMSPVFAPNGRWIAFVRYSQQMSRTAVMLVHPNGTGLHTVAKGADSVSFSPDGRYLLIGKSQTQSISITPTSGGPIRYLATGWGAAWQPTR
jgi:Tol biopolymer transport system component